MRIQLIDGPDAGQKFEMPTTMECVSVGSAVDNDWVLDADGVSRHHASFRLREEGWFILDLNSTNGTYVNGTPVRFPLLLKDGDVVLIGTQHLCVIDTHQMDSPPPETVTEKMSREEILSPFENANGQGDSAASPVALLPFVPQGGLHLGDYMLEKRIGAGGMGEVWRAEQISLRRKVAVKILNPELTRRPELVQRFLSEVRTNALLNHPNIVMAIDAGVLNGLYYLVIAYVNGENIEQILNRQGPIPEAEALSIVYAVASALDYAWTKFKLVHRDIKPANIMIDRCGDIKLMDLGISKSFVISAEHASTGFQAVGTPYYMSPEQAKNDREIDCQSDIYSLGITLFQMLAGHLPYNAPNPMAMLTSIIHDPVPAISSVNPEISNGTERLLLSMMAKDRRRRSRDWASVMKTIRAVMGENGMI